MQAIQGIILIIGVVFAHSVGLSTAESLKCKSGLTNINEDWVTMDKLCTKKMQEQVKTEFTAAMTYMAMGAYFARDTVNRPGFSKMFFESASEEREHAIKIIEYLLMRGGDLNIPDLIKSEEFLKVGYKNEWSSGVSAMNDSLELEAKVTNSIRSIIKVCEQPDETKNAFNDYHLVDYLTGDFLEEQYRGQRDLAGKISTLSKMMDSHGVLGEFLFDKKLLNGEPL